MDAESSLMRMHRKLAEAFKAQDPDNTIFDVTFEVDGKKLYANKFRLCTLSSTFGSMLSERWTSKEAIIKVESYGYQEFYNLLLFIYTGECGLNVANVKKMLDMSEFYDIEEMKDVCDEFISKMELNVTNILDLMDAAEKYGLPKSKPLIYSFFHANVSAIFESNAFMNLDRSDMKTLLNVKRGETHEELVFQSAYSWAENKCGASVKIGGKRRYCNMDEKIKAELNELLPLINFGKMSPAFFYDVIANKHFLFEPQQMKTLLSEYHKITVVITDRMNHAVIGSFLDNWNIAGTINKINIRTDRCISKVYTNKKPNVAKKDGRFDFYFVVAEKHLIVKKIQDVTDADHLICPMEGNLDFQFTDTCTIRVTQNCFV